MKGGENMNGIDNMIKRIELMNSPQYKNDMDKLAFEITKFLDKYNLKGLMAFYKEDQFKYSFHYLLFMVGGCDCQWSRHTWVDLWREGIEDHFGCHSFSDSRCYAFSGIRFQWIYGRWLITRPPPGA